MTVRSVKFTNIIVIESLESFEVRTGEITAGFLSGKLNDLGHGLPVEYHKCEGVNEFLHFLKIIRYRVELGEMPILHIECHGSQEEGLEFSNGSTLGWDKLANLIYPINLAAKFNLILCLSACHAASFLGEMGSVDRPCPCRALVAPHEEMSPSEAMHAFREFYKVVLDSKDINFAIDYIEGIKTERGFWIGETAEGWFRFTSRGYVLRHCSDAEVRKRVLTIHQKVRLAGVDSNLKNIKKEFMVHYRKVMFQQLFDVFFGLEEVPEIREKFEYLFFELKAWINEKGKQGLCVY